MRKTTCFFQRIIRAALSLTLIACTGLPLISFPTAAEEGGETFYDFSERESVKIACVGASTTEGTGGYSYPAFLQTMLGGRCEVRNFGYAGCSVVRDRDLSYLGSTRHTDSLNYKADIVIIDMGGNDSQPGIWNGGNNTFREDYETLVKSYSEQENSPLILISAGNLAVKDSWGINDTVIAEQIVPIQQEIAEKYYALVAPLRERFIGHEEEYMVEDGIHYTAAGYKAMAQLYYDTLLTGATFPEDSHHYLWKPTTINISNPYGEFDGYEVLQWVNGQTGYVQYDSGSLAAALDIENGTVVQNLTIAVSYFWDQHNGENDCLHFNTNDRDGLSAPGIANGKEHDNGYGSFRQYGMVTNQWATLTVSRDEQMLGVDGAGDWWFNVGALAEGNSLYINGVAVFAALEDGTVQTNYWGVSKPVSRTELNQAIIAAAAILAEEDTVYTDPTRLKLTQALETGIIANRNTAADACILDTATESLTAAMNGLRYALGDVDGDGTVNAADALQALQAATAKVTLSVIEEQAADVDQSGDIRANDALMILQHATQTITAFPVEG